jgi:hypothetical protein
MPNAFLSPPVVGAGDFLSNVTFAAIYFGLTLFFAAVVGISRPFAAGWVGMLLGGAIASGLAREGRLDGALATLAVAGGSALGAFVGWFFWVHQIEQDHRR